MQEMVKCQEIPGNLNCWKCNIILMTINEAYLVALSATVTLTYIPVMKPGLLDTFPGASWDISWAYWIVSWTIFDGNIDILARISSYIFWVSTVRLYVMIPWPTHRFPGPPDTFPGYIGQFPGRLLMQILIFYPRLVQWSGGKISIYPSKEVQEIDQYIQETCQEVQETCPRVQESSLEYNLM